MAGPGPEGPFLDRIAKDLANHLRNRLSLRVSALLELLSKLIVRSDS